MNENTTIDLGTNLHLTGLAGRLTSRLSGAALVALALGSGACVMDADDALEPDPTELGSESQAFMGTEPSDRNLYDLSVPMYDALMGLSCQDGPDMNYVQDYELNIVEQEGYHIQSFVYTGPFADGSARAWSSRSDGDNGYEDSELFRNKLTSQVASDGSIDPDGGDCGLQEKSGVDNEDHAAQLEWLPEYGSDLFYQGGFLFVAAEDRNDVGIYYYAASMTDDPPEMTSSSTRISRTDGGKINQVYIILEDGLYWLAIGESSDFEVWTADPDELFPGGGMFPMIIVPTAFSYHSSHTPSSGGGSNCYFVRDSTSTIYRLCFKNSNDKNCSGTNKIYASEVTIANGTFSIDSSPTYTVDLGFWGSTSSLCSTLGYGMRYPSFRASGSPYVDSDGDLHVYSLAFGGKNSTFLTAGSSSDGRTMVCN